MKRYAVLINVILFSLHLSAQQPVDWVDPFIGTTNFGTTNPGAVVPNGMMSVVPFNVMGSKDNTYDKDTRWRSTPYEYQNVFFTGYSHVNLSGVGCPDLGSLLVMPTTGELEVDYHHYGSLYDKEKASPGYYTNRLTKYDILTEVTASRRVGVHRYTFPEGKANILLNLGQGLTNESGAFVRFSESGEVEGMKMMGTFCYNSQAVFPVYFVMRITGKAPEQSGLWKKQRPMEGVKGQWDPDHGRYKIYEGNDDAGTLSAWAVFNMIGLYPDCPGQPYYTFTSPVFNRITIALDTRYWSRKELVIETDRTNKDEIYIKQISVDGKLFNAYRISHDELIHAGKISMTMTVNKPH